MKSLPILLGLAALASGAAAQAQPRDPWGAIGTWAGKTWIAVHGQPTTIVSFKWERPGQVLDVEGLTSAGQTFKGTYTLDRATGRIVELNMRNGKTYRSDYKATPDGFVEGGDQDGVQVRRIFKKTSSVTFSTNNQSLINGKWQTTREEGAFVLASPEWVKALGWKAKAP
jgi:hypothetical protein